MDSKCIKLYDFIGSTKKTFNIPVYQRNYDWKAEMCNQLFDDIERILDEDFEYQHFLGTIVYVQGYVRPNFMELVIIDGQQRITTIMLLMKVLYDTVTDEKIKADILEEFLTNVRTDEKYRIKLKPIDSDNTAYCNLINNEEVDLSSNIFKNYELLKKRVNNSPYSSEEIYEAVGYIDIVYISLEKDKPSENPQLIFESLNSTGLSLQPSDLIRNFLLMNHDYEKQTHLFHNYWRKIEKNLPNAAISDFIRDYLIMKTGQIPVKNRVYVEFKEYFRKSQLEEEVLLNDLTIYSEYYSWLVYGSCSSENINNYLIQINDMKQTVVYSPLMLLFKKVFTDHVIEESELLKIMGLLVSYLFRRIICGYASNALNKVFSSLCKELGHTPNSPFDYYTFVVNFLCSRFGSATFPRNDDFKNHFLQKNVFHSQNIRTKNFLLYFEKYLSKEVVNPDNLTIEHIMPQTLSPQWNIYLGNKAQEIHYKYLHTVGNLTLTARNSEIQNFDFERKKETYQISNISICREISEYAEWNEESILKRSAQFFEIANTLWSFPNFYDETINDLDYTQEFNIMENIDVMGEKPKELNIKNKKYTVHSWKSLFVTLAKQLYHLDNELFRALVLSSDFRGRERNIIATSNESLRSGEKIAEHLFLETNLSANAILNYCKILAEKFSVEDEISYQLADRNRA